MCQELFNIKQKGECDQTNNWPIRSYFKIKVLLLIECLEKKNSRKESARGHSIEIRVSNEWTKWQIGKTPVENMKVYVPLCGSDWTSSSNQKYSMAFTSAWWTHLHKLSVADCHENLVYGLWVGLAGLERNTESWPKST